MCYLRYHSVPKQEQVLTDLCFTSFLSLLFSLFHFSFASWFFLLWKYSLPFIASASCFIYLFIYLHHNCYPLQVPLGLWVRGWGAPGYAPSLAHQECRIRHPLSLKQDKAALCYIYLSAGSLGPASVCSLVQFSFFCHLLLFLALSLALQPPALKVQGRIRWGGAQLR